MCPRDKEEQWKGLAPSTLACHWYADVHLGTPESGEEKIAG